MSDPAKTTVRADALQSLLEPLLDLLADKIVERMNGNKPPAEATAEKLLFTTKEAAAMLGMEESWLAARARAKKVTCQTYGRYRRFSLEDINAIRQSPPAPIPGSPKKTQAKAKKLLSLHKTFKTP